MPRELELEEDDIIMRGGAESPPLPRDNESDLGSTVSNPLEDSEYVHRCQARHMQPWPAGCGIVQSV